MEETDFCCKQFGNLKLNFRNSGWIIQKSGKQMKILNDLLIFSQRKQFLFANDKQFYGEPRKTFAIKIHVEMEQKVE